MNKFLLAAGLIAAVMPTAAFAQSTDEMVCLITFGTPEEAIAGANDTAISGVYLPLADAQTQAAASGGLSAVFNYDYSTNADEQAFCEGPTFNPDDGDGTGGGGTANPNSAKEFAPGQLKGDGESAKDLAPGHQDGDAKDSAPGQQKKN